MSQTPQTFLKDYQVPGFLIEEVKLRFELEEDYCQVQACSIVYRNPDSPYPKAPLCWDGEALELTSLQLDGSELELKSCLNDAGQLQLNNTPERFTLRVTTRIYPQNNTALSGLYKSSGNFCSQCEAEGFRRISYFPDRPDVMTCYTVTIVANKQRYPVLLSNGNPIDRGDLPEGRHFVSWHDPFKKPAYLFALVAGDLACLESSYVTVSGKTVQLAIYVQAKDLDRCQHAMNSLKQAMQWDEQTFGLEYDLERYMVVAVADFNFGAMENKGLNVFNTQYVLAKNATATDTDFENIQGVIGHEYFHNWTGNRVTLKNWFQLSLKEGLTVFRDQQFTADMTARALKRIKDVNVLRGHQFPEDAGPLAHSVRPESYIEMNNFYTATVYNKGAEVVRMVHTIVGEKGFRKGLDLYFKRHDGQAVTCEDFIAAMADANHVDLEQFKLWYSQAGTPEVHITRHYDASEKSYRLQIQQSCPDTPGQSNKAPFHIPLKMGLIGPDGSDMPLQLQGEAEAGTSCRVLQVKQSQSEWVFTGVQVKPVPSLFRGFSAPVKMTMDYSEEELAFLLSHDSDAVNRWEAGQTLACQILLGLVNDIQQGKNLCLNPILVSAYAKLLNDQGQDCAVLAQLLALPQHEYLADQMDVVDVEAIHQARQFVRETLASQLRSSFLQVYQAQTTTHAYRYNATDAGRRAYKNICLYYLMGLEEAEHHHSCFEQFQQADNMTDSLAALALLTNSNSGKRAEALHAFNQRWQHDALVMDKWFAIQAISSRPGTLSTVKALLKHPAFSIENPNKVRALIHAFAHRNPLCFHQKGGEGYAFAGYYVLQLDDINPQVAARLAGSLIRWRCYPPLPQKLMRSQLQQILSKPKLSADVFEIVSKGLQ